MFKLKGWISTLKFLPQFPYAKILVANTDIMKYNDGLWTELREPCFKVVFYGLVRMQTIDMQ